MKRLLSLIQGFDLHDLIMVGGIALFGYGLHGLGGIYPAAIGVGSVMLFIGIVIMLRE